MSLPNLAKDVEQYSSKLIPFIENVPKYAHDIALILSQSFAISGHLRILHALRYSTAYESSFQKVTDDLRVVYSIVRYSAKEISSGIEEMKRTAKGVVTPDEYQRTWSRLWSLFSSQSGEPVDETMMARLRTDFNTILLAQIKSEEQQRQQQQWKEMPSNPKTHKRPSPARLRPSPPTPEIPPPPPPPPSPPALPPRSKPSTPQTKPPKAAQKAARMARPSSFERGWPELDSDSSEDEVHFSSPNENSALSASSYVNSDFVDHWTLDVFGQHIDSSAPLNRSGEGSGCYACPVMDAREKLEKEYEELCQLDFPGKPQISISFFLRDRDHRTKVLCTVYTSKTRTVYSAMPITKLEIYRDGSSLQLCVRHSEGKDGLYLWAGLQFSSMEKMVVFYCSFLALRGQDGSGPIKKFLDYELKDELYVFGGKIFDDNYIHALRIYRDHDTKAIRLQASIHEGDLEWVPVWTAFIQHYLKKKNWMRRSGNKIYLSKLQRVIFIDSSDYSPQITREGEHVLSFTSEDDANSFEYRINDLIDFGTKQKKGK
ncbi:hypothetical protein LOZ39_002322 [Ophidiomyces ophidiicola]|uniref:uncharacterized protein n=1 Tax=Ophidiomyces ophidiicola TaxID=1387563 RepID=UPI0020C512FC|nr:uncharacterized protein LOZ57_003065 [Ophidiomyces ophidiicola]KAI1947913.1 hypothetical protein LOZ57_003065 [Ophidiomyces ophidiicola]KAI1979417.1 hypothetical protein LOZ55_002000 [Ophidiomyces ophidiicola]KAI1992579.1 hypothetical protein LOZ54_001655 [Ophidiomyces ophidiicola]KAI1992878.1 hypothetical protein LOZ51_004192 [Ophidiomyces ophidiicola]KAI2060570.1 hypothetical protein LOZ43_001708 [Ophidiomyces ophidiicola]